MLEMPKQKSPPIIVANWKMNGDLQSINRLLCDLKSDLFNKEINIYLLLVVINQSINLYLKLHVINRSINLYLELHVINQRSLWERGGQGERDRK